MADKFLSCHSGKNLRSFCYREKLDYRQLLNAIRSRVSQGEDSDEEAVHLRPLCINDAPPMIREHFDIPECDVKTSVIDSVEPGSGPSIREAVLSMSSGKFSLTVRDCPVKTLVILIQNLEAPC